MNKAKYKKQVTVNIHAMSHDGRGITTIEGKTTFVAGALLGEKITCGIVKHNSRFNEAETLTVHESSPNRVDPLCQHFGVCGGCSMQHMKSDAQLLFKQEVLLEQLQHFGKVIPLSILPPISGNEWHYRRKARLGVRYVIKRDQVLVGFREKFSNFLTDIHHCPVLDKSVGQHIQPLGVLIRSLSQFNAIPQIEVAVSDTETALVIRHLEPLNENDLAMLCKFAEEYNLHFYLQPNSPAPIHKIWPKNTAERLTYHLPHYEIAMQFHPLDFIQVNGETNQLLLQQTLKLLDPLPTDSVLDLFCGLGNFTLPLAQKAQHVVGVEGSFEMVERAQENANLNNIQNVEFHAANLMDPSKNMLWLQKKYQKLLLDPPRAGAKELMPFIPNFSANKIVYVSCNPATLARDAGALVHQFKYKLKAVGVVNMFPHTSHIEAIALFEK